MQQLAGRVALITGGASGLGLGIARACLDAGMQVALLDLLPDYLAEAVAALGDPPGLLALQVDVADRAAMETAARTVADTLGAVALLVANAGIGTPTAMEDAGHAAWDSVLDVNLGGVVNTLVAFLPGMRAAGAPGHIVITGSLAGLLPVPGPGGIYATSKFALTGLAESLRLSLGVHGIGVSLLLPGLIRSRGAEGRNPRYVAARAGRDPGPAPLLIEGPSSANMGMAGDVAGAIVVEGVRRNLRYIFTHGEHRDELAAHFAGILNAIPPHDAAAIDPCHLDFERDRRAMTARLQAAADAL